MTGADLTPRQCEIVQVIEDSNRCHGYGPTYREIGDAVGLASISSVSYQLSKLAAKGYVSRDSGRPRTVVIHRDDDPDAEHQDDRADGDAEDPRVTRVPLVGRIAAGTPILANESVEEVIALPEQLVGQGDFIMLRVTGDSMINAAIADGDLVVVRRRSDVENGDIVAAMIENDSSAEPEATVKTFKRSDGHVWLIPHNPAFTPILGDQAEILGKVVAVLRRI